MRIFFFAVLLFSLAACKQKPVEKIKTNIRNTKTDKHIQIPGTRLFIIPPPGFTASTTVAGLQKGQHARIYVIDLEHGNFNTNAAGFNKTAYEQEGIKVLDYQEIKVNGYSAIYTMLPGEPDKTTISLFFGDTTFATAIMADFPAADETTGKDILAALNSIHFDKSQKVDLFAMVQFTLDDSQSTYKFFQFNGIFMYTPDGLDNTKHPDSPFFVATQFPYIEKGMTPKDVAEMTAAKMENYGLANTEVKNVSQLAINGYDAYQAEVYGDLNGKRSVLYQCVVAKGDKVISMQGIAKNDLEANVQAFRALAATVRIK